jgi:hypothetical protein
MLPYEDSSLSERDFEKRDLQADDKKEKHMATAGNHVLFFRR